MIRVCHIISGDLWAGAESVTYQLIKKIKEYPDIDVAAVLMNRGALHDKLNACGIKTWVFEENRNFIGAILVNLMKLYKKEQFNIIHSHRYKENFLSYLLKIRHPNLRILATQHGLPEIYDSEKSIKKRLIGYSNLWLLAKQFHAMVVVSKDIKNQLSEKFESSVVRVIHNGIEIPVRSRSKKMGDCFVIGSAGRLSPVKNFSMFIEICSIVHQKFPNVKFQIAGEGPERNRLENLVEKRQLTESLEFLGHVDNMNEFYKGLDIYLNTSHHEGISISVLEAMSCGIPTVAPMVGGFPEIIQSEFNGHLVVEYDAPQFAEICCQLIEHPTMLLFLSENASKTIIERFSDKAMASSYIKLYQELLNNSSLIRRDRLIV